MVQIVYIIANRAWISHCSLLSYLLFQRVKMKKAGKINRKINNWTMAKLILFPPNIIFLYTSSNSSYRNSLKSILIISLYAPLVKGNLNVGTVLTVNTSLITAQNKNTKNRTGRERGGMGLIFNKYFKALLVTIVLCTGMFSFHIPLKAASMYPLQTKYPDIMLYKGKTNKKVIALTF